MIGSMPIIAITWQRPLVAKEGGGRGNVKKVISPVEGKNDFQSLQKIRAEETVSQSRESCGRGEICSGIKGLGSDMEVLKTEQRSLETSTLCAGKRLRLTGPV